jgi:AAA+ superfamily predicted ATPase
MEATIPSELQYLQKLIRYRIGRFMKAEKAEPKPTLPKLQQFSSHLAKFIEENELNQSEITLLLIALAPHTQPDLFDQSIEQALSSSGDFPRIGGVRGKNFRGFLPTGETALFLLDEDDWHKRLVIQKLFGVDHLFTKKAVLWLEDLPQGEPVMSGRIILSQEYADYFLTGQSSKPRFGVHFPAQQIETLQDWEDLVLNEDTMRQVRDLEKWLKYGDVLLQDWGLAKKIKPGYRVLFHGPPGTGKTLTASLLGKYTGRDVYRVDLSLVVSKFIGETEKNLAHLFDTAENKDWILFFDEADALFGKRTSVRDAHDKYANQEVSFLLQRTESYAGLVILATNFKSNIDDAFARRFQSHIYFPLPKYDERLRLWQNTIPEKVRTGVHVDLHHIASQYELTGAHIINVVQHACLQAISRGAATIAEQDLLEGIRKEYAKEGKILK